MLLNLLIVLSKSTRTIMITTLDGEATMLSVQASDTVADVQRHFGDPFARILEGTHILSPYMSMEEIDESTRLTLVRQPNKLEADVCDLWHEAKKLSISHDDDSDDFFLHFNFVVLIGTYRNEALDIEELCYLVNIPFELKWKLVTDKIQKMKSNCTKDSFAMHLLEEALTFQQKAYADVRISTPKMYACILGGVIATGSSVTGQCVVPATFGTIACWTLECGECAYWRVRKRNLEQSRCNLRCRRTSFESSTQFAPSQQFMVDNRP